MKIAVFGASGMIGQQITLEALVRGHAVQALMRNPASLLIAHPCLTASRADVCDSTSVAKALIGADVAVNATGNRSTEARAFFLTSTHALIDAVKCVGTNRLLIVGGAGSLEVAPGIQFIDKHFEQFPPEARPIALAQRETLDIYRASDIDWTVFSPSAHITPGKRTGKYRLGTDQLLVNGQGESYISVEDFAVALVDEVENPHFIRQRFTAVSL